MALRQGEDVSVSLEQLLGGIAAAPSLNVSGLTLDSRSVQPGNLFVALPGEQHDGRNYIAAAREAGATAILAEAGVTELQRAAAGSVPVVEVETLASLVGVIAGRFYAEPSRKMHLVGVTGTNGKTTTSRLLAQMLRAHFGECGVVGTLGATLGNAAADALNTTPDAISLQAQLADWSDAAVEHAVLEVSSHALVQGRVNGLVFDTALFTNLTHDHLDYHGDMESYGAAKALLFSHPELRRAIVNLDDPFGEKLSTEAQVEMLGYSLSRSDAAIRASDIRYHDNGLEAAVDTPWGVGTLHSPLAGHFNLSNLLAALGAACIEGVPLDAVLELIPALQGVPGRMQYVPNDRGVQAVIDYAHTPDALSQALTALRAHVDGRLICVFGCGGDRDADKRPVMGQAASENADAIIVTSDNPRGEDPLAIIDDVLAGVSGPVLVETDRAAAIVAAIDLAEPGDCVLIAGKGHETYQQVGAERLPFSDLEHLARVLAGGRS